VIQKHGRPASWRHLAPAAFVLALLSAAGLSVLVPSYQWLLAVLLPYSVVLLFASLGRAARNGWQYTPLLPLAFVTMHVGYGLGFLAGIMSCGFPGRHTRSVPHDEPLISRRAGDRGQYPLG